VHLHAPPAVTIRSPAFGTQDVFSAQTSIISGWDHLCFDKRIILQADMSISTTRDALHGVLS